MECLGGNGVIDEFITARLYRDAPINAIWEGSATSRRSTCCARSRRRPDVLDAWLCGAEQGWERMRRSTRASIA
jgi:putative acyl-CoA dehydrogenase